MQKGLIKMTNRFTPKAQEALEFAKEQSKNLGHTYIGTEHLLLGITCTEGVGAKILDQKGALYTKIYDQMAIKSGIGTEESYFCALSPRCKKVIEASLSYAKKSGSDFVGTEHLLYSICDESECAGYKIICSLGISPQGVKTDISAICEAIKNANGASRSDIVGAPMLSIYGKSLNSLAFLGAFDPLIGRKKEISLLIQTLCRRNKNNPCLIGDPGVGKTAIVEGLAQMISSGNVPSELKNKIIVSLDMSAVLAGTKYRGEFEERMRAILNEAKSNPNIILFIDEIHTITGAGGAEGAIDASNIMKPSLSRGEIRVIGATTIDEFRKSIEKDSALERRFQSIIVDEPTKEEALEIIKGIAPFYEKHHGVKISNDAIARCVSLSDRYINDRFFPDKAIDILDEACALLKLESLMVDTSVKEIEEKIARCNEEKEEAILDCNFSLATQIRDEEALLALELNDIKEKRKGTSSDFLVDEEIVYRVIAQKTKIPMTKDENDNNFLLDLENTLKKSVIGQDKAIKSVVSAIKRGRIGIASPNRPSASFLFLGPTGVGKTHLAKEIARTVFKSKNAFIRLDMSEYAEKHSVSRLIGAPAGYVGYEDGGKLCEMVRANPYSVVLFDEIEKAHPDIYNLLLQILDEGELTSSMGRKISFKNTIVILTSNIGAENAISSTRLGFGSLNEENKQSNIDKELKRVFTTEFLNRLDEIIAFEPLSFDDARKICSLMIDELTERAKEKGIFLDIDSDTISTLTKIGYSKEYGARSIRRAITGLFENSLCDAILNGEISLDKRVFASFEQSQIKYKQMLI